MSGDVEVHRGGELTLKSPAAVRQAAALMRLGVRVVTSGDSIPPSAMVRHLLGALELAERRTAVAAVAAVDVDLAQSGLEPDDLIDTTEVAAMIGCKVRNARDLCANGGLSGVALRVGGQWRVSRADVAAHLAERSVA